MAPPAPAFVELFKDQLISLKPTNLEYLCNLFYYMGGDYFC